jgi:hypothetical protein
MADASARARSSQVGEQRRGRALELLVRACPGPDADGRTTVVERQLHRRDGPVARRLGVLRRRRDRLRGDRRSGRDGGHHRRGRARRGLDDGHRRLRSRCGGRRLNGSGWRWEDRLHGGRWLRGDRRRCRRRRDRDRRGRGRYRCGLGRGRHSCGLRDGRGNRERWGCRRNRYRRHGRCGRRCGGCGHRGCRRDRLRGCGHHRRGLRRGHGHGSRSDCSGHGCGCGGHGLRHGRRRRSGRRRGGDRRGLSDNGRGCDRRGLSDNGRDRRGWGGRNGGRRRHGRRSDCRCGRGGWNRRGSGRRRLREDGSGHGSDRLREDRRGRGLGLRDDGYGCRRLSLGHNRRGDRRGREARGRRGGVVHCARQYLGQDLSLIDGGGGRRLGRPLPVLQREIGAPTGLLLRERHVRLGGFLARLACRRHREQQVDDGQQEDQEQPAEYVRTPVHVLLDALEDPIQQAQQNALHALLVAGIAGQ